MTPRGHRNSIFANFNKFARHGDLVGFDAYVGGQAFTDHLAAAGPKFRQDILKAHKTTRDRCAHLAHVSGQHPVSVARESDGQVSWKAPGMIEKLRAAYARAKTDEAAARILGVSRGAAQIARKRYLDAATTSS